MHAKQMTTEERILHIRILKKEYAAVNNAMYEFYCQLTDNSEQQKASPIYYLLGEIEEGLYTDLGRERIKEIQKK